MTLEKLLRMEVPAKDKDGNVIKITPEFRLAVQDLECVVDGKKGVRVIVHANGHNSDTVDLWVCGNQTRKFYQAVNVEVTRLPSSQGKTWSVTQELR